MGEEPSETEMGLIPKDMGIKTEQSTNKDDLKRIGTEFLDIKSSDPKELHDSLQSQIQEIYQDIKSNIDLTSDQTINDSIVRIASDSPDTPAIGAWLPIEYQRYEGTKMECTLGSAMVKLALEEAGSPDARTALLKEHQVAIRNNEDGSITIFDPTTTHTTEGQRHGFMADFSADQVVDKQNVYDKQGNLRGQKFRVETKEKPEHTGMFDSFDEERQVYYRDFFTSEPDTLVELSVVLENLDNDQYKARYDSLKGYDARELMHETGIFNHKDLFEAA
jgi:hypothetical protein